MSPSDSTRDLSCAPLVRWNSSTCSSPTIRTVRYCTTSRSQCRPARAFLKDAPLLILDEPTSSVDVKTEAVILEAMDRLMQGRTAFLITHRLSALATCDARLQLEQGRLVETAPTLAYQVR